MEELEELEENRIRYSDYYFFVFQLSSSGWKTTGRQLEERGAACLLEELEELEENDVIGCYH